MPKPCLKLGRGVFLTFWLSYIRRQKPVLVTILTVVKVDNGFGNLVRILKDLGTNLDLVLLKLFQNVLVRFLMIL